MANERIAVIGDRDTVTGFRMVGVRDVSTPSSPEETRRALLSFFRDPNMGLIIITERLAETVNDTILELAQSPVPVILLVPDRRGSTGTHEAVLRELIRRAVGIEIGI
ncbi:MAG: V-type ATP synthase subunit F [Candidatus Thorarchaeota archaeon]|nr:V-type ATP synthase subunit F [Candidatus Thorarchaeota archaeon]